MPRIEGGFIVITTRDQGGSDWLITPLPLNSSLTQTQNGKHKKTNKMQRLWKNNQRRKPVRTLLETLQGQKIEENEIGKEVG